MRNSTDGRPVRGGEHGRPFSRTDRIRRAGPDPFEEGRPGAGRWDPGFPEGPSDVPAGEGLSLEAGRHL